MIGTTLGHFKIGALLGQGGMGAVYRAEDSRLGRQVAIKVLPPSRMLSSHEHQLVFAAFGQTTYDVTPDGGFAVMHYRADEEHIALLIQNWPALLERAR